MVDFQNDKAIVSNIRNHIAFFLWSSPIIMIMNVSFVLLWKMSCVWHVLAYTKKSTLLIPRVYLNRMHRMNWVSCSSHNHCHFTMNLSMLNTFIWWWEIIDLHIICALLYIIDKHIDFHLFIGFFDLFLFKSGKWKNRYKFNLKIDRNRKTKLEYIKCNELGSWER